MIEQIVSYIVTTFDDLSLIETNSIVLVILLVVSVIVVDGVSLFVVRLRKESGFEAKSKPISVDGGKALPVKHYVSDKLQLAGRPDAVIVENGYSIPVEHKPFAKKIHDRYAAQLLVYMRLIEEIEGKKPPYGYLIIGPQRKRIKIENTEKRQAWLQRLLDEMHAILEGGTAKATPLVRKCRKCDVKDHCAFKMEDDSKIIHIGNRRDGKHKKNAVN